MSTPQQIAQYIASQPSGKQQDLNYLHQRMLQLFPGARLWMLEGKNDDGKIISNPNIGYGNYTIRYADGSTRDFYQIGLSGTSSGISVYIMGLNDKHYIREKYGVDIGKASITGYCIRFKQLKDIDIKVLETAIRDGFGQSDAS